MQFAPIRNMIIEEKPWEGICKIKPWEYQVTAVIPVLDTYESLSLCVELLRLQTVKPYIIVVDTGSTKENIEKINNLIDEDLEVHSIKLNGVEHPSDFVAMAMDLAQSLCRTKYLFATRRCFLDEAKLFGIFVGHLWRSFRRLLQVSSCWI